jgi:hypothetical protein
MRFCSVRYKIRLSMRGCAAVFGITAILMGLMIGPFVHVHLEGDDSHGSDHEAIVHAHFLEVESGWHHSDGFELGDEHHHHHGSVVTAMAASSRRIDPLFVFVQVAIVFLESSDLPGHTMELTVRVHDPPSFRNSNPRSPPSC